MVFALRSGKKEERRISFICRVVLLFSQVGPVLCSGRHGESAPDGRTGQERLPTTLLTFFYPPQGFLCPNPPSSPPARLAPPLYPALPRLVPPILTGTDAPPARPLRRQSPPLAGNARRGKSRHSTSPRTTSPARCQPCSCRSSVPTPSPETRCSAATLLLRRPAPCIPPPEHRCAGAPRPPQVQRQGPRAHHRRDRHRRPHPALSLLPPALFTDEEEEVQRQQHAEREGAVQQGRRRRRCCRARPEAGCVRGGVRRPAASWAASWSTSTGH
jgi:hypothetical protein